VFKISEFARMTQVSAKALRLYDELGLLKPAHVDPFTDYRYYSADQLPRLHRIIALKELGFSLEQIKPMLDDRVNADQIKGMLMLKRAEAAQAMQEEQARLMRIEARLQLIELEGKMTNYEVIVKQVPAERVAGVKGIIPDFDGSQMQAFNALFDKAFDHVYGNGVRNAGCGIAVYYNEDGTQSVNNAPVEAAVQIGETKLDDSDGVEVHVLPAATMATTVHKGKFDTIGQAYDALMKWIEANGYRIAGSCREVYVKFSREDLAGNVTEIQFPVEKA
jgi:DNA-binding transcriptional MerR regulator